MDYRSQFNVKSGVATHMKGIELRTFLTRYYDHTPQLLVIPLKQ